jgi:hypothetical protein
MDAPAAVSLAPHDLAAVVDVRSVPNLAEAAADAEADVVLLRSGSATDEGWHDGVLLLTLPDLPGIEIWSVVADAAERFHSTRELAAFISRPDEAVDHPPTSRLAEWDRQCLARRVVAVGGLGTYDDTESAVVLSPQRNGRFFRVLRTHLLCEHPPSGELDGDRALVYDALMAGRCFLGRDSLAGTRGFRFYAEGPEGLLPMGAEASAGDWTLHARLPFRAEIRLIRDGEEIERTVGSALEVKAKGEGVYRVEAWLEALGRPRTWILSNPIYLRRG